MSPISTHTELPRADHAPTITVVLMGVSGSGKSTVMARIVERFAWPAAEGDDFHPAENVAKMAAGDPLTDADRRPWLRMVAAWIGERERTGENGVITLLRPQALNTATSSAKGTLR